MNGFIFRKLENPGYDRGNHKFYNSISKSYSHNDNDSSEDDSVIVEEIENLPLPSPKYRPRINDKKKRRENFKTPTPIIKQNDSKKTPKPVLNLIDLDEDKKVITGLNILNETSQSQDTLNQVIEEGLMQIKSQISNTENNKHSTKLFFIESIMSIGNLNEKNTIEIINPVIMLPLYPIHNEYLIEQKIF